MIAEDKWHHVAFILGISLLISLTGCARNPAKIVYSSPPVSPAIRSGTARASDAGASAPFASPLDDAGFTDNLQSALIADRRIRATNVSVSVHERIVTLRGVLNSEAAKDAAAQDCLREQGVRAVVNQITVDPEG